MRLLATVAAVILLLIVAYRRGGEPEKYASLTFALALATGIILRSVRGAANFRHFDFPQLSIEAVVLVAVLAIAVRANRWWPICVASLQVLIVAAHLAKLAPTGGMAGVYWLMTTLPTYCQYLVLGFGVQSYILRQEDPHHYPDWRAD